MILEATVALSLLFGTPNGGCKETRFYYNRNYYAVDVITFVDSSIKDISAIKYIFPVNTDSSFFRYQECIALDYKQLDMVFSYVVNSSSNIISSNRKNINLENCLWVVNAYKDVYGRINALVRLVDETELFFGEVPFYDASYPLPFFNVGNWKLRINNGTYFLITNIGYGCSYAKNDEEQMEKMNHVKMPKITFLDEPTFQYPSIILQTTLHNHYETYQNSEKLISEYCLNYTTIFELNNEDLAQLKYRVINSKHHSLLRKKELVGIAYKDRYGRIDVGLYLPVKSNTFLDIKPRRQKVYCFYDLYETRPDCRQ